jgi:predicted aspartyl protease
LHNEEKYISYTKLLLSLLGVAKHGFKKVSNHVQNHSVVSTGFTGILFIPVTTANASIELLMSETKKT